MAYLARITPHTPLDTLRVLLAEYSGDDNTFRSRLGGLLQQHRRQLVRELGRRLGQTTTPKGIRRGILAQIARFDWAEWTPHILAALQQEGDLGVFDDGCAALGLINTREAFEALKQLQTTRNDPDRQTILARELSQFSAQMSLDHYVNRLLEGNGNAKLAIAGAKILAAAASPAELPALSEAYSQGDELTQRLVLRVLCALPGPEVLAFLLHQLASVRDECLDLLALAEGLRKVQPLQRASLKPEMAHQVVNRFQARVPEAQILVTKTSELEGTELGQELDPLKAVVQGACDRFTLEAYILLVEGKFARFSAFVSETTEAVEKRLEQLNSAVDSLAETVAYRISQGLASFEEVRSVLLSILKAHLGGEGFIQAFLFHLPAQEVRVLDELLADPDLVRRQKYLNALGSREDDALVPFFMKAMQDSIVDVGLLATHHLGKLPSSFPALMELFNSGHHDQVRLAIRVFGENQCRAAAEPLLDLLQRDTRDDLLVDAADALASLGYAPGAPILLSLLHDGKPLSLQIALAKALGNMGTPDSSLGLLERAASLKQAMVLILCLEGAMVAFSGFDHPMPSEKAADLLQLAERCFDDREGEGQRLRAMLAMQNFYAFDREAYDRLRDRFSDFLFDMRTKENWDRENNDKVASVIKELNRRSTSLGLIAKKEASIREKIQSLPAAGPKRVDTLLALRDALQDPELIIRPQLADELETFVVRELETSDTEWREVAHLCEIGGLSRKEDLRAPIRDIYQRATGLGLKSAARSALLSLGLSEADLNRKPPVHSILVLEPSGFFRKRIMNALGATGLWTLSEASNRQEADKQLELAPVDLVLTESQDGEGDLGAWLEERWGQRRFRQALFSTSNRDLGELAEATWVLGTLFKPYPPEQLLRALDA